MDPLKTITTAAKVKSIAAHLKAVSDEDMVVYIEDASLEVSSSLISTEYKERASRYLAAHFASLNIRQVQNQKAGDLSQTFQATAGAAPGLDSTSYGQEYLRILKKFNPRPSLKLTVL